MINKVDLVSVISKYYLNGMIEPVKWDIKDETLTIKFNAPSKDMIGRVVFKGMPLEDSTIAVSNTTQLNKLIGITNGYLELSYVKINKFITKLIIADIIIKNICLLASPIQISDVFTLKVENIIGKKNNLLNP